MNGKIRIIYCPHHTKLVIARKNDEAIHAFGLTIFWNAAVCRVADLVPLGGNGNMFTHPAHLDRILPLGNKVRRIVHG